MIKRGNKLTGQVQEDQRAGTIRKNRRRREMILERLTNLIW